PSGCPGTTLCAQSSIDTSYKKLLAYLDKLGLQPNKEPAPNQTKRSVRAVLLSQDRLLQVSTLGLGLSNPTQPALTANLFYTVKNSAPFSVATVSLNGALSYVLYVDGSGQVQKQLPPSASATA